MRSIHNRILFVLATLLLFGAAAAQAAIVDSNDLPSPVLWVDGTTLVSTGTGTAVTSITDLSKTGQVNGSGGTANSHTISPITLAGTDSGAGANRGLLVTRAVSSPTGNGYALNNSAVSVSSQAYTVAYVLERTALCCSSDGAIFTGRLFGATETGAVNTYLEFGTNNTLADQSITLVYDTFNTITLNVPRLSCNKLFLLITVSATQTIVNVNGVDYVTNSAPTSKTMTALTMGSNFIALAGKYDAQWIFGATLNSTQRADFYAWAKNKYGVIDTWNILAAFEGDSKYWGTGSSDNLNVPRMVPDIAHKAKYYNLGVPSKTVASMVSDYSTTVAPIYDSSFSRRLLILGPPHNDLVNGVSAATAYASMLSLVSLGQTTGWTVICETFDGGRFNSLTDTTAAAYNASLVAGAAAHGYQVVDFSNDARVGTGTSTDALMFNGTLHLTATGYGIKAGYYGTVFAPAQGLFVGTAGPRW
jgi:hypothetical protein